MTFISVPRPLRDKLGDEASDSLIELFQKQESDQKAHLFEVLEDRFSRRLEVAIFGVRDDMGKLESGIHQDMAKMESGIRQDMAKMESGIREDMNRGFLEVGKQFTEVHKEISGIHKAISGQTKWLLIMMLAGLTIYPVIQKLVDKF